MHTIRGRLALWYAVALGATMFVFALTIYLVQRSENLAELDARARLEADFVEKILSVAQREPGGIIGTDPQTGRPSLAPRAASLLEVIPDYVLVLGSRHETLYLSADARALPYGSLVKLLDAASDADTSRVGF